MVYIGGGVKNFPNFCPRGLYTPPYLIWTDLLQKPQESSTPYPRIYIYTVVGKMFYLETTLFHKILEGQVMPHQHHDTTLNYFQQKEKQKKKH